VHLLQGRADREAVDHSLSRRNKCPAQLAEDPDVAFAIGIPPLVYFLRLLPELLIVRLEVTMRRSLNKKDETILVGFGDPINLGYAVILA